ncbi:phosphocholine cytidylyltransferase family protein [Aliidiomarina halalkaliphila]|uniref:Phosphocholine cytidylyltransferase family protein n=1 Tax=Aliidiomarina halalkaliphila TaxID=2593535 RepID=A0A552X597_9GAMM|nr:phosphocholine cytidylyltransferase family protein [Aliidiomarina halalkaliphila]TRW50197.1 phosphocholine cytidylyltransferase family protein [Aliidiomarina halalkaliphila]
MKVIFLAAGQGTRLRPYTIDRPKCMVEINGRPMLHYQLKVLSMLQVPRNDQAIVGGYLQDKLDAPGVKKFTNPRYERTNMVSTLFCAQDWMQKGEDLVICYGDIVYEPCVMKSVLDCNAEVCLAADLNWRELWALRMDNPLDDAETFKVDKETGNVTELGKTPKIYSDIQAQYMGIIKIRADKVSDFVEFYNNLDRNKTYDGKDFDNMYMTSFIQELINHGWEIKPAFVHGGWVEVDSVDDLHFYSSKIKSGDIKKILDLDTIRDD